MASKGVVLSAREVLILKQACAALEAQRLRAAGNKQFPELARKAFEEEVAEIRNTCAKLISEELPL